MKSPNFRKSRLLRSLTLLSCVAFAGGVAALPLAAQEQVDLRNLGHFQGNPFAPVQIVEFADVGCSACGLFHRDVKPALLKKYVETGRVGWRMIPIRIADFRHSAPATKAAICAARQDGFFELEQMLYDRQREWQGVRDIDGKLGEYVSEAGLDLRAWRQCYNDRTAADSVALHNRIARDLAIRGTPTFFINNQRALGALPEDRFVAIIEAAEAEAFR